MVFICYDNDNFRYVMNVKCKGCGKTVSSSTNKCDFCFTEINTDADFEKGDNDFTSRGTNSTYKLLLALLFSLIVYMVFFSPVGTESNFNISNGNESYGSWYRDGDVYRNDYLNMSAVLTSNKNMIKFYIPSTECTEYSSTGYKQVLNVNGIPVKYFRNCNSRGIEAYFPESEEENNVVVEEFKKSQSVLVKGFWLANNALFSAVGFTKTYQFMAGAS